MLSSSLVKEIQKLGTIEECKEVYALLKVQTANITISEATKFRLGQKVWFVSKKRGISMRLQGVVARINKKSISVETDDGGKWSVSPSLLNVV
jgi:hypothetical protein